MRKLIVSLALATTAAMAAPAAAQYYPNSNYGYGNQGYGYQQGRQIEQRIYQLRQRLQRVTQRGRISQSEARRLYRDLDKIERRYDQYARNGLSSNEQYDLQRRIQNLQEQIREDRRDGRRYDDDRRYNDGRYYDRRDRDDD